jgi:RNA polymerase sigma-70 factor, ECF subfamily
MRCRAGEIRFTDVSTHWGGQAPAGAAVVPGQEPPATQAGGIADDRLRLIFTCCHPALPLEARVALTLRTLAGLTTAEMAHRGKSAALLPAAREGHRRVLRPSRHHHHSA